MTTTYDAEQTEAAPLFHDADPTEVVCTYDDSQTIIAAWSSSALGELDGVLTEDVEVSEADDRRPAAARAKLLAALAAGVIGGATLGAVLFGFEADPPTVVVPGFGVSTKDMPAVAHTKTNTPNPSAPLEADALPVQAPKPGASAPGAAPTVDTIPNAGIDPGAPAAIGAPAIDVWIPPLPAFIDNKPVLPVPPAPPAPPEPVDDVPALEPPTNDVVKIADPNPALQAPEEGSRFTINPFPKQQPPAGGLKPIDRSTRFTLDAPKKNAQTPSLSPANRATLSKP